MIVLTVRLNFCSSAICDLCLLLTICVNHGVEHIKRILTVNNYSHLTVQVQHVLCYRVTCCSSFLGFWVSAVSSLHVGMSRKSIPGSRADPE